VDFDRELVRNGTNVNTRVAVLSSSKVPDGDLLLCTNLSFAQRQSFWKSKWCFCVGCCSIEFVILLNLTGPECT